MVSPACVVREFVRESSGDSSGLEILPFPNLKLVLSLGIPIFPLSLDSLFLMPRHAWDALSLSFLITSSASDYTSMELI